jgi:hypothetical protein
MLVSCRVLHAGRWARGALGCLRGGEGADDAIKKFHANSQPSRRCRHSFYHTKICTEAPHLTFACLMSCASCLLVLAARHHPPLPWVAWQALALGRQASAWCHTSQAVMPSCRLAMLETSSKARQLGRSALRV